ncbi:hypothetical protein CCHR01_09766 [Colletotrichum chrysophilum]|uniref:Uncharacterized protein n=1 Tax=Colletotrichum chrysophilum TaxID=1836956 RepID=A0AAD9AH67_9PEZI|nr:hypothetical protein CCHR01_09766 [Colletotrichum chrysophilum]
MVWGGRSGAWPYVAKGAPALSPGNLGVDTSKKSLPCHVFLPCLFFLQQPGDESSDQTCFPFSSWHCAYSVSQGSPGQTSISCGGGGGGIAGYIDRTLPRQAAKYQFWKHNQGSTFPGSPQHRPNSPRRPLGHPGNLVKTPLAVANISNLVRCLSMRKEPWEPPTSFNRSLLLVPGTCASRCLLPLESPPPGLRIHLLASAACPPSQSRTLTSPLEPPSAFPTPTWMSVVRLTTATRFVTLVLPTRLALRILHDPAQGWDAVLPISYVNWWRSCLPSPPVKPASFQSFLACHPEPAPRQRPTKTASCRRPASSPRAAPGNVTKELPRRATAAKMQGTTRWNAQHARRLFRIACHSPSEVALCRCRTATRTEMQCNYLIC